MLKEGDKPDEKLDARLQITAQSASKNQPESMLQRSNSASVARPALSPGMAQYMEIKSRHEEYLLFYRMGDFYELFFDDAVKAAVMLDIALTKRGKIGEEDIPMCGVPVHSSDQYLEKLIAQGAKVAICEQLEDPSEAKKRGAKSVVMRDVVRIVTPGTLTEDSLLTPTRSNYLAALAREGDSFSLAWADISTGECGVMDTALPSLAADLARLNPSELLLTETLATLPELAEMQSRMSLIPTHAQHALRAQERLKSYYRLEALDAFGELTGTDLIACASVIDYLQLTQKEAAPRLDSPRKQASASSMAIDAATRRNLELISALGGGKKGSLLASIDHTVTAAGARLLAARLTSPLTDPAAIEARLDSVSWMATHRKFRDTVRETLRHCPDMERALSRLLVGRGGPRDMLALASGLNAATKLRGNFFELQQELPRELDICSTSLGEHTAMVEELARALKEDAPLLMRDGGFVRTGYHAALDEFRSLRDESRRLIAAMQTRLAQETGIASLKIKHNNVLGYFIEITRLHEKKVPEHFIHRQTMKDALRYCTVELGELERKISEAADRALKLELEIFDDLLQRIREHTEPTLMAARALAVLDVSAAFAQLAALHAYCRPTVDASLQFNIVKGRHPVVEDVMRRSGENFIGNGCDLGESQRLWLLTGPNMAGKSTFLRQNALIAILAQIGSFVPAESAHIGVVDRLFSRVGASDDLARGRSTFMVEMVETAAILTQATSRSLVILDEIGRGTATFDGLSLAWAVVEHLHNTIRCRGLFATHYHELTHLAESLPALALYTMKVKEWRGEVIFLHEVKQGKAEGSYGIHVARLAGLPEEVIARAGHLLTVLEEEKNNPALALTPNVLPLFASVGNGRKGGQEADSALSPAHCGAQERGAGAIKELLISLNPDELSPKEALEALYKLKALM